MKKNFFNTNNYNVVKEAITPEMAFFLNKYIHNKRQCFTWMQETKNISHHDNYNPLWLKRQN